MQGCLNKPKVVKIGGRLQWKCYECGETWNIDPRNMKAASVQYEYEQKGK